MYYCKHTRFSILFLYQVYLFFLEQQLLLDQQWLFTSLHFQERLHHRSNLGMIDPLIPFEELFSLSWLLVLQLWPLPCLQRLISLLLHLVLFRRLWSQELSCQDFPRLIFQQLRCQPWSHRRSFWIFYLRPI